MEGPLANDLRETAIKVSVVPCAGKWPLFRADPGLRDHFLHRAPDIVHAHNGVWTKSALAARAADVPVILHTAHGFDHDEAWFEDILRWWAGCHTDLVVTVSDSIYEHFVRKVHIAEDCMTTILNGVDATRFSPGGRSMVLRDPLGMGPEAPLIGCVARFDPVKNHALLIQTMALLARFHPEIRLALVGDGPLRENIKRQVSALGLSDMVLFTGMLADTAPVYRDVDVFVLPSTSEGTSISVLEAMSSETAVVATHVGGTPMLLDNGSCGSLVPSENAAVMAAAIDRLLKDKSERSRLGQAARKRVLAEFDHAAMVRAYERLYAQAIRRSIAACRES
jgi:glycosyltransferase involved in cell wall biosynthesis